VSPTSRYIPTFHYVPYEADNNSTGLVQECCCCCCWAAAAAFVCGWWIAKESMVITLQHSTKNTTFFTKARYRKIYYRFGIPNFFYHNLVSLKACTYTSLPPLSLLPSEHLPFPFSLLHHRRPSSLCPPSPLPPSSLFFPPSILPFTYFLFSPLLYLLGVLLTSILCPLTPILN
jgi:hypothetical protein